MTHGGDLTEAMARYGGAPESWLDLSTGINPHSWPIPPLPQTIWQRLPSRADETALLDAARVAYGIPDDVAIAAAPGTQMLIQWLPRLAPTGTVAIVGPTYNEHAAAWSAAGHEVVAVTALNEIPEQIRHVVIVNPNNPDGRIVDHSALTDIARMLRPREGSLVLDEAFADIDPACSAIALCRDLPVLVLRSFGKFYGLAGLRLGFVVGPNDMIERYRAGLGPWACSGPALAIGAAALRDRNWADRTRMQLREQARKLDTILSAAGFTRAGGMALFRLVRHPHASSYHDALARQHIWCRKFGWADDLLRFGLPPDEAAFERLADALAGCR